MAQAAVRIETARSARRSRGGRATALFKAAWDGLSRAYRTSREREELGRSMSTARIGRDTGVRC